MRILIGALAVALLAGCAASVTEMRQAGPLATLTSAKPESELAKCTLFAWQNQSLAGAYYQVTLQPRPGGGESVVNQDYREIADFYKSGSVTKIDFFTKYGSASWITDRRISAIRGCL